MAECNDLVGSIVMGKASTQCHISSHMGVSDKIPTLFLPRFKNSTFCLMLECFSVGDTHRQTKY